MSRYAAAYATFSGCVVATACRRPTHAPSRPTASVISVHRLTTAR